MKKTVCYLVMVCVLLISCGGVNPKGRVKNVTQGDVLVVPSTFTDSNSLDMKVRLLAIRCPSADSEMLVEAYYGALATQFTEKWVNKKLVRLERPIKKADGLRNRRLAFVIDAETNEYLHEALLKAGLARSNFEGRKFEGKEATILALEEEAKKAGRGMWTKEHPTISEMRDAVDDTTSMMKKLADAVTGKSFEETTVSKPKTAVEPVKKEGASEPQPQLEESLAGQLTDLQMALERLRKMQSSTGLSYRKWLKAPEAERLATAKEIRGAMRYVKIQMEDVLDDFSDELSEVQKTDLKASQTELSKLMLGLKKYSN